MILTNDNVTQQYCEYNIEAKQDRTDTEIKKSLFDKMFDIAQKAGDLMELIDEAIKDLDEVLILSEEDLLNLGSFSYSAYMNALIFREEATKLLKKGR